MSETPESRPEASATPIRSRSKLAALVLVAAGVLAFVVANAHLVYVAVTSEPACVEHVKPGQTAAGRYSAARSSC